MSKRNKKTQNKCEDHVFQLKALFTQSKLPDRTYVSFCESVKNRKNAKTCRTHQSQCVSYPVYNSDHNHATPSFILQQDKCHFSQQGQRLRQQHDMKMGSYLDQKESLNIPKPKSKTNHCNVCRQSYEDYLTHIQSQAHIEKSKNNIYTKHINQLVQKFQAWKMRNKHQNLNSSYHTMPTQGQDQKEFPQCMPKKRIKVNENLFRNDQIPLQLSQGRNQQQQEIQYQNVQLQQNLLAPSIDLLNGRMQNNFDPHFWYNPYFYPMYYPENFQNIYPSQASNFPFNSIRNYPDNNWINTNSNYFTNQNLNIKLLNSNASLQPLLDYRNLPFYHTGFFQNQ